MSETAYRLPPRVDPVDVVVDFLLDLRNENGFRYLAQTRQASSDFPADLVATLPFCLVDVVDIRTDRFGFEATVDIHVFAGRYTAARDIAYAAETDLLGYPVRVSSGGKTVLVDRVDVDTGTREVEWQTDSSVRRFLGTYTLSVRR